MNADSWSRHGFRGTPVDLAEQGTLVNRWLSNWIQHPSANILFDSTVSRWVTAQELADRSLGVAARFVAAGLQMHDRLAMSCLPSVDMIVTHVAAMRAGLTVVPINTGFTDAERSNIVTESSARLLITDANLDGADLPQPGQAHVDEVRRRTDALRADDPAMLLFTSGTTGRPKGAMLSHGYVLSSAAALVTAWEWKPSDRLVLALPLFHMHGLGVGVHGTLLAGASAVVLPSFSPDSVFDSVRDHDATLMFGVPTMWVRLLASPRVGELANLRLCVSGSAPLATDVWNGLAERAGQHVVERYGMTETVMLTSNPLSGERRAGTVGLALPGVEVRLHEPGLDHVGEICVRGPNVFAGYLDRPEANAEAFTNDGWFRTGDLGRFDEEGYLSIVGRSKDLIITGGYNVYPRDVEEIVRQFPGVADCAVIGEPSIEWGETVTAAVIAKNDDEPLDIEELLSFAAVHLAGYQRPRRVVVMTEFPRNALGKVVKAELAKQVAHRLPGRVTQPGATDERE